MKENCSKSTLLTYTVLNIYQTMRSIAFQVCSVLFLFYRDGKKTAGYNVIFFYFVLVLSRNVIGLDLRRVLILLRYLCMQHCQSTKTNFSTALRNLFYCFRYVTLRLNWLPIYFFVLIYLYFILVISIVCRPSTVWTSQDKSARGLLGRG